VVLLSRLLLRVIVSGVFLIGLTVIIPDSGIPEKLMNVSVSAKDF